VPPPNWLQRTRCQWAVEHQLSKLLGTPFGIDLHTGDVDTFLLTKVQKKLTYWTTGHLSLTKRALIVNSMLLYSLWFFIVIWVGSLAILRELEGCSKTSFGPELIICAEPESLGLIAAHQDA
jgi:hypothetical protein